MQFSMGNLSLATRISLATSGFIAIAGIFTALALYGKVHTSLKSEIEEQCMIRITDIQSSIDADGGHLELEHKESSSTGADHWQVTASDGTVLWQDKWQDDGSESIVKARNIFIGENPSIAGAALKARYHPAEGQSRGYYDLPGEYKGIQLRIAARASTDRMRRELSRLALALWTIGPFAVICAAGILAIFIRVQLRPLSKIATAAAAIGPRNIVRIGEVGNSLECVHLRDSINRMVGRLAEGLERERQFASIAAHELRTPVAQLRTNIEVTLRKERAGEEYRASLADCLSDVTRLQNLIANLLLMTRHQLSPPSKIVSVGLCRAIEQARQASNSRVALPAVEAETKVQGDETLLVCAIRNVLENAERYAPGEAAQMTLTSEGTDIVLAIRDSGPGIPEHARERIFEPLVRLDQARTIGDSTEGFGLGLTVARAAARSCGGELVCLARPDQRSGAEFRFILKRAVVVAN